MAWVTEEEYQAAKQVRAYEYLQTYQPGRLKKTRTRNEWQLQDHDSFKINEITSKWHESVQSHLVAGEFLRQSGGLLPLENCRQTAPEFPDSLPDFLIEKFSCYTILL